MNLLLASNDAPKITDWITAIAAIIGVPLSAVAFFKLVRRDKDRQDQIDKLTNIAGALENQTEVLVKQNELIAQQVDIFRNTNLLKGNDAEAIAKLQAIEEQRIRLSVQPRIILSFVSYRPMDDQWHLLLLNRGEFAHINELKVVYGDLILDNASGSWNMEKGDKWPLFGRFPGLKMVAAAEYQIEISYMDVLGHNYKAIMHGKSSAVETIKDEPVD